MLMGSTRRALGTVMVALTVLGSAGVAFATQKVGPRFNDLSDFSKGARDALKFENVLREAYVDIKFRGPLSGFSLRAGRQQIIWGESDGFRMLDRVNNLDLSWHFQQELPPPGFG